ncbi:hypothetical protein V500_02417 [Pseudogymnoascus sp. VKM F-4518 (FW-2643)]|nr:hypothetical protein V500_02417 [Pseudogymnoascus sp. VKM F-4518 (FW-2643)]
MLSKGGGVSASRVLRPRDVARDAEEPAEEQRRTMHGGSVALSAVRPLCAAEESKGGWVLAGCEEGAEDDGEARQKEGGSGHEAAQEVQ